MGMQGGPMKGNNRQYGAGTMQGMNPGYQLELELELELELSSSS